MLTDVLTFLGAVVVGVLFVLGLWDYYIRRGGRPLWRY